MLKCKVIVKTLNFTFDTSFENVQPSMKRIKLLDLFLEQAALHFCVLVYMKICISRIIFFFSQVLIAFKEIPRVLQFDLQE